MRLFASLFVGITLAVLAVAPSHAAKFSKKDLHGSWQGDVMAIVKSSGMLEQMPPGFDPSMLAQMFELKVTFKKDGKLEAYTRQQQNEETEFGSYEVISSEGNVLRVKHIEDDGSESMAQVTFVDKDTIVVLHDDDEMGEMKFTRIKGKVKKTQMKVDLD